MLFHYMKACRRKLANEHLTKKINKKIYDSFMEAFVNYCFKDNISKKRIIKELTGIEKNYKLNDVISKYYVKNGLNLFLKNQFNIKTFPLLKEQIML